jgi:hypothetical protein
VLSHKKKYGAKQVRYANGSGMNAKREEVEMRAITKKEVETAPADAADRRRTYLTTKTGAG